MKKLLLILIVMLSVNEGMAKSQNMPDLQRSSIGVWDNQINTKSNIEFYSTNYGILAHDVSNIIGGGIWPRWSRNQYIFGQGFWFGAKKEVDGTMKKLVSISYNPNSGKSWYVPGRIDDGDEVLKDEEKKYRIYYSTDFDNKNGVVENSNDGPNWPLWVSYGSQKVQYGMPLHEYIDDPNKRNLTYYTKGPLFFSDEHIFATYKDTDLSHYEGGAAQRQSQGYPLRLQVEENVYTWESGVKKDVMIIIYKITNMSSYKYEDCWFAPVIDCDIAIKPNTQFGAGNDNVNYFDENAGLNLVYSWSNPDRGEREQGFGYLGVSMLESPAVDNNRDIRHDKLMFEPSEQIGLATFRNWSIVDDKSEDEERYDFLSSGIHDGDTGTGDKRILMATGPFNLKPGETAWFAIGLSFALPAKGGEADGTFEDITGLSEGKVGEDFQALENSLVGMQETIQDEYYSEIYNSVNNYIELNQDAVYPNPANNWINLEYTNEVAGNVRVSIVNVIGTEISELANGFVPTGNQKENFILNNINSGMYFLKIETPSGIYSKKIIISK